MADVIASIPERTPRYVRSGVIAVLVGITAVSSFFPLLNNLLAEPWPDQNLLTYLGVAVGVHLGHALLKGYRLRSSVRLE